MGSPRKSRWAPRCPNAGFGSCGAIPASIANKWHVLTGRMLLI